MVDKIRWGILSTGKIANAFAQGLQYVEHAELIAVGSRSAESADAFGEKHHIPRRYATYEALAADPDVDIVYIGTPHPFHKDNTLLCLNHGKSVLCEKVFAMNTAEAREMIETARTKRLFLMEAMWTRYVPLFVKLRQMLADRVLGEISFLQADFGFQAAFDPTSRIFAPELGGSALLDVGIYPVSLASLIFQTPPDTMHNLVLKGQTGVDEQVSMQFGYAGGKAANLYCATRYRSPVEAVIVGEKGHLRIHSRWHHSEAMTLSLNGEETQFIAAPIDHNGYRYEAAEATQCLLDGQLESPIMPLDETLAIMQTIDRIQASWRVVGSDEDVTRIAVKS
ncbi:MAG: Gfo/Idh/MocA family oxidoreductase [Anaerolineae bacterium]|jgi:predicted dehydrogenase|nr:Gfo/Idh/MocA family oxidoreductase [Anaerolineae bacterium]